MYTLKLTEQEIKALAGLIDSGVRALGLASVKDASQLLDKIQAATPEAEDEQSSDS